MPLSITASDRKPLMIGLGVVIVLLLVLAALSPEQGDQQGYPSSYSPKIRGAKAAFLLLKQSGYNVERWTSQPQDLPRNPGGTVMVIAEPRHYPSREELNALKRFISSGGTLLLAGGSFAPEAHISMGEYRPGWTECKPAAPTRLTRGGLISLDGFAAWTTDDRSQVAHYEHNAKPVVVSYRIGKGEVIWWASALPLTNAAIRDRGNLALLVNSIGDARLVLWDEYFHGERHSAFYYARNAALKWGLTHLAIFAVVVLFTFARRSGPLLPLVTESRLTPLEFVDTLGGVYHRAGATQAAVEIAFSRFRQVAARRLGLFGQVSADEMARAIELRRLATSPEFTARLRRCEQAISDPGLREQEALELLQFLNRASLIIEKSATFTQEKPHASHS